jgi:two-component system, sensor histidine kinase
MGTTMAGETSRRLLLAEDDEVNRAVARLMLERLGHSVVTAVDGFEVLDWLKRELFDAVLLDIRMPRLGGVETAKRIRRSEEAYSQIPIIALTAYAMAGDRERFLAEGMNGYLSKPYEIDELKGVLDRVVGAGSGWPLQSS